MNDQLLNPLRSIARDLVDKRLWPVAVLLLAALVAMPFDIGSGSDSAPTSASAPVTPVTPVAPAVAGAPGYEALVTLAGPAVTGKDNRPGTLDDPFYDPPAVDAGVPGVAPGGAAPGGAAPGGAASAGAAGGGGVAAATGAGGFATGPPASSDPPDHTTPPRPAGPAYQRTEARWYDTSGGAPRPLVRLTPLGGDVDTAAMYLGVTKSGGTHAVFLLGPGATSEGEALCVDGTDCRVIGLKAGQTQLVTVKPADGSEERQYSLEVTAVRTIAADAATARTMRLKVHAEGRDVMRAMWQDAATAAALGAVQFDRDSGLLVRAATKAADAPAADVPAE